MTPRNRDIIDAEITLVSTTKFEHGLVIGGLYNVDDSACVLLLTETFKHKVISCGFLILYKVVLVGLALVCRLDHQRVCTLAYFTLESLPEKCAKIRGVFLLPFDIKPLLQTEKMNVTHRARAFARAKQWVVVTGTNHPTEATLFVLFLLVCLHDGGNLLELFPFLVIDVRENRV